MIVIHFIINLIIVAFTLACLLLAFLFVGLMILAAKEILNAIF